jgi:hypothetical protein
MDKLFNRLVENALDFLQRAVSDLAGSSKYSVIHFNTAVELFLKARLMHEHWSLIISKRSEPDWEKFVAGDFQSVTLDEAASRLEKVVRSGLTTQELEIFRDVAKHRNKIMHFFHDAHSAEAGETRVRAIAKQQLVAWYSLHQLLRVRWATIFEPWSSEIERVDRALKKSREYLQVTYDQLGNEIKRKKAAGVVFRACPSCQFEAEEHDGEVDEIYEAECLVCDFSDGCLRIECPDCSSELLFRGEGFGECDVCGRKFEPRDLADIVEDEAAAYIAAKEGDDSRARGNCSDCDGFETLIQVGDEGGYACVSCLRRFDKVQWCQWCNTPNSGDMENSYFAGCNMCDGKSGWDGGRDD